MENSPPHTKRAPPQTFELAKLGRKITLNFGEDLFFFFFFFFFWRSPNFGRKKRLNFGFRPKKHSEFWRRPFFFFFFGDHLILGGKNLWISEVSETFRLKFRTNRLKLIQGQWKFESTSYAHFSLFQNSPLLFQILATRLDIALASNPLFFNAQNFWTSRYTLYGTSIDFKNINSPYFAIFLKNYVKRNGLTNQYGLR